MALILAHHLDLLQFEPVLARAAIALLRSTVESVLVERHPLATFVDAHGFAVSFEAAAGAYGSLLVLLHVAKVVILWVFEN